MSSTDEGLAGKMDLRRLVAVWSVLLVVLLGGSWYKAKENQLDRQRQTEWQNSIARLEAESRVEYGRLQGLLNSSFITPLSRRDLELELNAGEPFDLKIESGQQEVNWTHPQYGILVRLRFENDLLKGWSLNGGSPTLLPVNAQPKAIRFDSRAEVIRQLVRPCSICLWLAAAAVAIVTGKYSPLAAQLMLATSLTYGAATVVSPIYDLTVNGIFSNDAMFWAVIMYAVSLVALAKTWPGAGIRPQFRIRDLILATTAAALLLTLGPIGFFAFAVFSVGALFFFCILIATQRHPHQTQIGSP